MQSITEKLGAPPVLPSVKNPPSLRELSLNITVSTPMAGGGVEAGIVDGKRPVRVPSVRGHLRYWWRMMNRNRLDQESDIWGSTENPGKVYVSISEQPKVNMRYCNNNFGFDRYGPENYALFSLLPNRQEPGKNIAQENFTFTLSLRYPEKFHDDVRLALSAWIYFGGLGARTRRGCGSLSCDENPASLGEILRAAPYITLWRKKADNSMSAWSYAVKRYRDYRQYRNGRFGRSKWPEPDSLRQMTGEYPDRHKPRNYLPLPSFPRAALGMPIIFHFKDRGEPNDVELIPDVKTIPNVENSSRMASPVITKALCDNGTWYSAVIILPHDDIFRTKLKFKTKSAISNTEKVKPLKCNEYRKLETMPGQSDAISGFEEYISGDFTKEGIG